MSESVRKITAVFWIPVDEWSDDSPLCEEDVREITRLATQGAVEMAYAVSTVYTKREAQYDDDWTEAAQERFFSEDDEDDE